MVAASFHSPAARVLFCCSKRFAAVELEPNTAVFFSPFAYGLEMS